MCAPQEQAQPKKGPGMGGHGHGYSNCEAAGAYIFVVECFLGEAVRDAHAWQLWPVGKRLALIRRGLARRAVSGAL